MTAAFDTGARVKARADMGPRRDRTACWARGDAFTIEAGADRPFVRCRRGVHGVDAIDLDALFEPEGDDHGGR